MASPIRITADLSDSLNNILNLAPDGMRAFGERLMEERDDWRDSRRMRNIAAAAVLAVPEMNADATAPDDDWLSEWFDLASKRSHQDWQHALAKMLAIESNAPGSAPLRYFTDMARLDNRVIAEFKQYCGYIIDDRVDIVKNNANEPRLIVEANLVRYTAPMHLTLSIAKRENILAQYFRAAGETIRVKNDNYKLPTGNIQVTNFGRFVYSLLDPKPPPAPDLVASLREMWREHLYDGNVAE